ncbi:hypothetical protein FDUTEX481_02193 [Tolypothrix sp. PCC 7601]|nr:hypothetical protein FDUTEX481_02193 [Tolypothrix sp. PCC 7601]
MIAPSRVEDFTIVDYQNCTIGCSGMELWRLTMSSRKFCRLTL